jgi:hypothetical protein
MIDERLHWKRRGDRGLARRTGRENGQRELGGVRGVNDQRRFGDRHDGIFMMMTFGPAVGA